MTHQVRPLGRASGPGWALLAPALAALAILTLLASSPAMAEPAGVTGIKLESKGDLTRLAIGLSHDVSYEAFGLGRPYRLVIDLPDVAFRIHEDAVPPPAGIVKATRMGLFAPGKSRVQWHARFASENMGVFA